MSSRILLIVVIAAACAPGAERAPGKADHTTYARDGVARGVARGATTEVVIEGLNLAGATRVYFSDPGLTGRVVRVKEIADLPDNRLGAAGLPSTVDLGPLPPRYAVTLQVEAKKDAPVAAGGFPDTDNPRHHADGTDRNRARVSGSERWGRSNPGVLPSGATHRRDYEGRSGGCVRNPAEHRAGGLVLQRRRDGRIDAQPVYHDF